MYKTTKQHHKYWSGRKIDWVKDYQSTWNHPHRGLLTRMLHSIQFESLFEVGCGGGANLVRIVKDLGSRQLGGCDVNPEAIEACEKALKGGVFEVSRGDDILMSDKSADVVLSDMTLIYVDPVDIDKYLKEYKRIARSYVMLCEFHSESWWKRQVARFTSGYHVYNYKKRLQKQGFWDIYIQQIPEQLWPGTDKNTEFRSIITARV
jgi:ubiquinone/menaquinone biosynthesis C-methylase UbiE